MTEQELQAKDCESDGDNPEQQAFRRQLKAMSAATLSMTGTVSKRADNLYRVQADGGTGIRRFDLQGSSMWAGAGSKQSAHNASGYVTLSDVDNKLKNKATATVTYEEAANGIDLENISVV